MTIESIREIIQLKKEGKRNKDIAITLNVHVRTIDYWIKRLRAEDIYVPNAKRGKKGLDLSSI